jgi:hypothetical protein
MEITMNMAQHTIFNSEGLNAEFDLEIGKN